MSAAPEPDLRLRSDPLPRDRSFVRRVLEETGVFRADEVAIGVELVDEARARGEQAGYHFLFAEQHDETVGYACFGPVPLTVSSWDLYWIAVTPASQGTGIGRTLLCACEEKIRTLGGSQLFVDTSGRAAYAPTRAFYSSCGYEIVATLDDFYAPADAKVVFRRKLEPYRHASRTADGRAEADAGLRTPS